MPFLTDGGGPGPRCGCTGVAVVSLGYRTPTSSEPRMP